MIRVIISAQVKCLLVSAGWGVAFVVGLWMQMAHAQRAQRRSFVRKMTSVLRPWMQVAHAQRALRRSCVRRMPRVLQTWMQIAHAQRTLRRSCVRRMASVRSPLQQAIDLWPTIVRSGVTNPIEQTGAKRGNPGLPQCHQACEQYPLTSALNVRLHQQRFFVNASKTKAVSA